MNLISFSHCYGQLNYHVVLVTKYRKRIFISDYMRSVLEVVFRDIAKNKGYVVHEIKVLEEHVHMFITMKPNQSISEMFMNLKGISARIMFQLFPEIRRKLYGGHLWSRGKFVRSAGAVTAETIERYIQESQEKHLSVYQATPFRV